MKNSREEPWGDKLTEVWREGLTVFIRGMIGFVTLLIMTRFLGKQHISQLTFFDYVFGITIGSTASSLTSDLTTNAWQHFVGLLTWTGAVFSLQMITLKWRRASKYIDGEATVVVMNGKVMDLSMRKLRLRASDLLEQLRIQGVFDLGQVEFAILESNGNLSVKKKSQNEPLTPVDLGISTKYEGVSTELILDGIIFDKNLQEVGLDRKWLEDALKKQGILSEKEVFLATLNTQGELFVDKYKDHLKNITDVSDYTDPLSGDSL